MTIKTIKLSEINSPVNNPRKSFNEATIEGLATSIKNDGLLQNLVVASKGKKYQIISGERRFRALLLLLEKGDIQSDFEVPVEVRKNLSKHDQLRVATVENVQREKLPPMDEAEAITGLVQKGVSLSDIAVQTGLTEKTTKRRLALANLCDEVKQKLRNKDITLSVAEAFTTGSHDAQRHILERINNGYCFDADDIKNSFLNQKPNVSMAIFSIEQYQGTYTADLFAEEESTFFDDVDQFFKLQNDAISKKQEDYINQGAAFVDITVSQCLSHWEYGEATENEIAGVVINLSPCGEVEILENVVKHEIDEDAAQSLTQTKIKPFYSLPIKTYKKVTE